MRDGGSNRSAAPPAAGEGKESQGQLRVTSVNNHLMKAWRAEWGWVDLGELTLTWQHRDAANCLCLLVLSKFWRHYNDDVQ